MPRSKCAYDTQIFSEHWITEAMSLKRCPDLYVDRRVAQAQKWVAGGPDTKWVPHSCSPLRFHVAGSDCTGWQKYRAPRGGDKASPNSTGIDEILPTIEANDKGIEAEIAGNVASHDELLPEIDLELAP
jgi:hypothetical protein